MGISIPTTALGTKVPQSAGNADVVLIEIPMAGLKHYF